MIVVDASVAVKWFIPEPGSQAAHQLLVAPRGLIAPALIRIEVTAAILRLYREDRLPEASARAACGEWSEMLLGGVVRLIADDELYPVALEMGFKTRHALQDCLYLAAGKAMDAEVVTADRTLHERGNRIVDRVSLLQVNGDD